MVDVKFTTGDYPSNPLRSSIFQGHSERLLVITVTVQLFNGAMPPRSLCPLCEKYSFLVYTECGSCSARVCEGCLRAAATTALNRKLTWVQRGFPPDASLSAKQEGLVPCPECAASSGSSTSVKRIFWRDRERRSWGGRAGGACSEISSEEWEKAFQKYRLLPGYEDEMEEQLRKAWGKKCQEAVVNSSSLYLTEPGVTAHASFTVNRLAMRHMFRALELDGERIWPRLQGEKPPSDGSALVLQEFEWTAKAQNQLNGEQIRAIGCIVNRTHGSAPMVVFGPPGTGKTL